MDQTSFDMDIRGWRELQGITDNARLSSQVEGGGTNKAGGQKRAGTTHSSSESGGDLAIRQFAHALCYQALA